MEVYIFDMDGTLIDSMPFWDNLMPHFLDAVGVKAEETLVNEIRNMPLQEGVEFVREKYDLPMTKEEIVSEVRELLKKKYESEFLLDDSVLDILHSLKDRGKKLVLATATQRYLVNVFLKRFNLAEFFDMEVVSDESIYHKDDPEYFLRISNEFNVAPKECVVVEDALYAMETAHGVGMNIAAVTRDTPEYHMDRVNDIALVQGHDLSAIKEFFITNEEK